MDLKQRSIISIIQCMDSEKTVESNLNHLVEQMTLQLNSGPTDDGITLLENLSNILKIKLENLKNEEYYSKEKIKFFIDTIFNYIEKMTSKHLNEIPLVAEIFQVSLQLINPDYFEDILNELLKKCKTKLFSFIMNYVNKKLNLVKDIIPELHLKLFETAFDVLLMAKYEKIHMENLLKDELAQLFVKIICFADEFLAIQTILWIVPKYLDFVQNNQLLNVLWNTLMGSTNSKPRMEKQLKVRTLLVLCVMVENFFPKTPINIHFILLNYDNFWEFIQDNLLASNYQMRKQTLFLLKRAITISSGYQIDTQYFQTQPKPEDATIWSYFFLIIESLEQRQLHLINPSFDYVVEICAKIHISWSILLYRKMLSHKDNQIILWALLHLDYLNFTPKGCQNYAKELIPNLVPVLNNPILYASKIREKIFHSLKCHFQKVILTGIHAPIYFKNMIEFMGDMSWDPLSHFCFSYVLSLIPQSSVYNASTIYIIKSQLESSINAQNHYIRCATESCFIRQIINLSDIRTISLHLLGDFFGVLRRDTIRKRSQTWDAVLNFISTFSTEESTYNFISYNISSNAEEPRLTPKSLARIVVLLLDLNKIVTPEKTHNLALIFAKFVQDYLNTQCRPYGENWSEDFIIFIKYFYKELNDEVDENEFSPMLLQIKQIFQSALQKIIDTIFERIKSCSFLRDFHRLKMYCSALKTLFQVKPLENSVPFYLFKTQKSIANLLKSNESIIQKIFYIKFFVIIRNIINLHQSESLNQLDIDHSLIVREMIENGILKYNLKNEFHLKKLTKELKTIFITINYEYMEDIWFLYLEYIKTNKNFVLELEEILDTISEGIEDVNNNTRVNMMAVMELLLKQPLLNYENNKIPALVEKCYKTTFEFKKSKTFLPTIFQFCSMIFQPPVSKI